MAATSHRRHCQRIVGARATNKKYLAPPSNRAIPAGFLVKAMNFRPTFRRMQRQMIAVLCAFSLSGLPSAGRENVFPQPQDDPSKIKVAVQAVLVEATVKNKAGQVMGDLKKEDFLLADNGTNQEIAHFSRDQLPLAVALVVDLSGSIKPFLKPLRYATLTAVKALKPEDEVSLFTFTDRVDRRVDLTKDKRRVADEFEFIEAGGATNINDGVYEAAEYLRRERPAARRVIVLVSDNVATYKTRYNHEDVVNAALEADAAVYSLKVPGENPVGASFMGRVAIHGLVNVTKLTDETGGEIFDVQKTGSLFLAFQALIERLKTRYTLGFYPGTAGQQSQSANNSSRSGNAAFHKIDVRLRAALGNKGNDYSVVSKRGYFER